MLNLQRVTMFIAVVDAGRFTLAAAALGQTKAVVSFNVRQLENELGVTLLLRSTRRLRLGMQMSFSSVCLGVARIHRRSMCVEQITAISHGILIRVHIVLLFFPRLTISSRERQGRRFRT